MGIDEFDLQDKTQIGIGYALLGGLEMAVTTRVSSIDDQSSGIKSAGS